MKGFFKKKTLEEASFLLVETLEDLFPKEREVEIMDTREAYSRITASPVVAPYAVPVCRTAAMDGIALLAGKTFGATKNNPYFIRGEELQPVNTGNPVPEEYDAVIKIEDIQEQGEGYLIFGPATPGQHIRLPGEDIRAQEVILPTGQLLRAQDIGALLACAQTTVAVQKRPSLAILPTGSELIPPGNPPGPGEVVEFNSQMVASLVKEWGGEGKILPGIKDDPESLQAGLLKGADEFSLLVTIAGSSAGSRDYLPGILEELGVLLLHGVSIQPGKPFFFGTLGSTLVLGLPGYPVSCYLTAHLFLRPALYFLNNLPLPPARTVEAISGQTILSSTGVDEFVRVSLGQVGGQWVAQPLPRGASIISSLTQGDGFLPIQRLKGGVTAGEIVKVEPFFIQNSIRRLFVSGSFHPLLESLREHLFIQGKGVDLVLGGKQRGFTGLKALKRRWTHLASLYVPPEALSAPLLQVLEEEEAYFLHLASMKGEDSLDPLFLELGEPLYFGLLFLPYEQKEIEKLVKAAVREDFLNLVEQAGYSSEKTGSIQQVKGE